MVFYNRDILLQLVGALDDTVVQIDLFLQLFQPVGDQGVAFAVGDDGSSWESIVTITAIGSKISR